MRPHAAGAEIDHAARCVEQPRVRIPLIDRRCEATIRLSESLDASHGLGARDQLCDFGPTALRRGTAANAPGKVEGQERVVETPSRGVVVQPPAPRRDISEIGLVLFCEAQREGLVGEGRRPGLVD